MLDERPTAAELVAAVADFLDREVHPALDGRTAFHARVAANALRIVERELTAGPAIAAAELARLRALTAADGDLTTLNTVLAGQIRDGIKSTEDSSLRDHLVRSVLARMAVDNPRYPSLPDAAARWPGVPAQPASPAATQGGAPR